MGVRRIVNYYGQFMILMGAFLTVPLFVALFCKESTAIRAFLLTIIICIASGLIIRLVFKTDMSNIKLKARDSYVIVTVIWLIASVTGCIPYMLTGSIPNFFEAFFETCSGFTTTGSTVISDIESLPRSILLWRSFTQWLGGMGIIVLFFALMPRSGIKAQNIATAETPGPTVTKLTSKFTGTAQRLYLIYVALTATLVLCLLVGGMSIYDAVNHAFTTMATGGFSTYNDSIAHFDSYYIHWVLIVFMFIAGTNFELFFIAMHGHIRRALRNEEFRLYSCIFLSCTAAITASLLFKGGYRSLFKAVTDAAFQVVTIITTTGFATADYDLWPIFCRMVLLLIMVTGACSSSTAGGLKLVRVIILSKMVRREINIKLHETIVKDVTLDGRKLLPDTVFLIVGYGTLFFTTLIVSTFIICLTGQGDFVTNLSAVLTCISNVGPGFDSVGPTCNFHFYSSFNKFILSMVMLAGRLEISTFFILFSRYFWKPDSV